MIEITDRALQEFKSILSSKAREGQIIRLVMGAGGCCGPSLGIDIVDKGKAGDAKFKNEACAIFIDKRANSELDAATLNYVADGVQEGFFLKGLGGGSCCG